MRYFLAPSGLLVFTDALDGSSTLRFAEKILYKVDALLAQTKKTGINLRQHCLPNTPLRSIPFLTDSVLNNQQDTRKSTREMKNNKLSIACFGNLVSGKNQKVLIELFMPYF